jgi:hypothetical protein
MPRREHTAHIPSDFIPTEVQAVSICYTLISATYQFDLPIEGRIVREGGVTILKACTSTRARVYLPFPKHTSQYLRNPDPYDKLFFTLPFRC